MNNNWFVNLPRNLKVSLKFPLQQCCRIVKKPSGWDCCCWVSWLAVRYVDQCTIKEQTKTPMNKVRHLCTTKRCDFTKFRHFICQIPQMDVVYVNAILNRKPSIKSFSEKVSKVYITYNFWVFSSALLIFIHKLKYI